MLWTLPKILLTGAASVGMLVAGYLLWTSFQSLTLVLQKPSTPSKGEHSGGGDYLGASIETVLASTDEIFVNLRTTEPVATHFLRLKLELELFQESNRSLVEQRKSGIKDTIIQISREQDFQALNTLGGKLYFKELIVSRINEFLKAPAVREVRFAAFYIQ